MMMQKVEKEGGLPKAKQCLSIEEGRRRSGSLLQTAQQLYLHVSCRREDVQRAFLTYLSFFTLPEAFNRLVHAGSPATLSAAECTILRGMFQYRASVLLPFSTSKGQILYAVSQGEGIMSCGQTDHCNLDIEGPSVRVLEYICTDYSSSRLHACSPPRKQD